MTEESQTTESTSKSKLILLMMPPLIKSHSIPLWLSNQLTLRSSSHSTKTGLARLGMIYFTRLCGLTPSSGQLTTLLMVWKRLKPSFNTLLILCKLQVLQNEKYMLNGAHFKRQSKHMEYQEMREKTFVYQWISKHLLAELAMTSSSNSPEENVFSILTTVLTDWQLTMTYKTMEDSNLKLQWQI